MDVSTDKCPIRTFVLDNGRLPDNGTVKADSLTLFNTAVYELWDLVWNTSHHFCQKRRDFEFIFFLLFIKSRSIIEIFADRSVSRSIKIVNQFQMIFLALNITFVNTIIGTNCLWSPCPTKMSQIKEELN